MNDATGETVRPTILRAEGIEKFYPMGRQRDGLRVLRGIDLTVGRGEVLAIVGASGTGKSTLLHLLGALDRPSAGRVFYTDADGRERDIFRESDDGLARFRNREVGFVFQFHHLLPEFTALENAAMPALILGEKPAVAMPRAEALLREVGLGERLAHKPGELSGGEQQRVAIARALVNRPRLILADEPSGNLDGRTAAALHDLMLSLARTRSQTFVIVTHNEELAERADRTVRIADGAVVPDIAPLEAISTEPSFGSTVRRPLWHNDDPVEPSTSDA